MQLINYVISGSGILKFSMFCYCTVSCQMKGLAARGCTLFIFRFYSKIQFLNIKVLVKLFAAGVNPVDTYIRTGTYARKPTLPYTPGADGAGVVKTVGEGVSAFKVRQILPNITTVPGIYCFSQYIERSRI